MAIAVTIRCHVLRHVFVLALNGFHIGGHLERQQALGLKHAWDDVEFGAILYAETQQYGIGRRLQFGKHEGSAGVDGHYHRFVAH